MCSISISFLDTIENNSLLIIQPTICFLGFLGVFLSKIDEILHLDVFKTSLDLLSFIFSLYHLRISSRTDSTG